MARCQILSCSSLYLANEDRTRLVVSGPDTRGPALHLRVAAFLFCNATESSCAAQRQKRFGCAAHAAIMADWFTDFVEGELCR